jgi:dolichyl-phosphate-mannose-protein mannosyltransferase
MNKIATVKLPFEKREIAILAALLLVAFVIRLAFFPIPGYITDMNTNSSWFQTAADYGPRLFYQKTWSDYPPLNVYLFWAFGSLAKSLSLFGSSLLIYILKLPATLFDIATSFLIFAFVRKRLSFKMALLASGLYALNPVVIFDSAVWGQFDGIYTFFLVLSVYLILESKPKWATAVFMLAVLTKPQSIALAPLIIFLVFRMYNWNWKKLITPILAAAATIFAVILPFEWNNPVTFLFNIYFGAYNNPVYQITSFNAFNIWGFNMYASDTQGLPFLNFNILGWIMFGTLAAFTLYFIHKRSSASPELYVIFAAFVLLFGFFMLPTRIHERYMFPVISMLALMFPFIKKTRPLYLVLTTTCLVNQAYVLYWLNVSYVASGGQWSQNLNGDPVVLTVSLINIVTLVSVLVLMLKELRGKKSLFHDDIKPEPTLQKGNG